MIKIINNENEDQLNYMIQKHNARVLGFTDNKTLIEYEDDTDYEKLFIKARNELTEYKFKELDVAKKEDEIKQLILKIEEKNEMIKKLDDYRLLMENDGTDKISLLKKIERLEFEIENQNRDWSGMDFQG